MQCKVTNKISDQKILATMLLELVVYISYIFGVKNGHKHEICQA